MSQVEWWGKILVNINMAKEASSAFHRRTRNQTEGAELKMWEVAVAAQTRIGMCVGRQMTKQLELLQPSELPLLISAWQSKRDR